MLNKFYQLYSKNLNTTIYGRYLKSRLIFLSLLYSFIKLLFIKLILFDLHF